MAFNKGWLFCFQSAESDGCPGFYNSMMNGKPTWTKTESTLADGLAVSLVGYNSYASASPLVDKVELEN